MALGTVVALLCHCCAIHCIWPNLSCNDE